MWPAVPRAQHLIVRRRAPVTPAPAARSCAAAQSARAPRQPLDAVEQLVAGIARALDLAHEQLEVLLGVLASGQGSLDPVEQLAARILVLANLVEQQLHVGLSHR